MCGPACFLQINAACARLSPGFTPARPTPFLSSRPPFQALLEGISLSQPQPKIPPELIKFLGKSFAAWHIAIPLLESHVIIFPDESRCFDALAELYKQVSDAGGGCTLICQLPHGRSIVKESLATYWLMGQTLWQSSTSKRAATVWAGEGGVS